MYVIFAYGNGEEEIKREEKRKEDCLDEDNTVSLTICSLVIKKWMTNKQDMERCIYNSINQVIDIVEKFIWLVVKITQ